MMNAKRNSFVDDWSAADNVNAMAKIKADIGQKKGVKLRTKPIKLL